MFQIEVNFHWWKEGEDISDYKEGDLPDGGDMLGTQPYFMQCSCQRCREMPDWQKNIEYWVARAVYEKMNNEVIPETIEVVFEAINSGEADLDGSPNITA